jgi:hypothetical protein
MAHTGEEAFALSSWLIFQSIRAAEALSKDRRKLVSNEFGPKPTWTDRGKVSRAYHWKYLDVVL